MIENNNENDMESLGNDANSNENGNNTSTDSTNYYVSNTSASQTTNKKDERIWKIKEYDHLKQALKDTIIYYNDLQARKDKFSEIDGLLHRPKVFEGPISDDCHENGYNKLNGYLISLMKDVNFIEEWLDNYIKACSILEDETQTTKEVTINDYTDKISIKSMYSKTNNS